MSKKVLVTGGNGRLGNYMCTMLKEKGYLVSCFDVVPPAQGMDNFDAKIPFVSGDLTNLGDCMRAIAFAQADVIVHLAGIPGATELLPPYATDKMPSPFKTIQRQPEDNCFRINTMGTFYMLDAARRLGVKDFIFASSYYATGIGDRLSGTTYAPQYLPVDEAHPCDPEGTYALSKYIDEVMADGFARGYGMNVVGMRLMGVYYENSEMSRKLYNFGINVPAATDEDKGYMVNNTYQYVDARDIVVFVDKCIGKMGGEGWKPFEAFFVITDSTYFESSAEVVKKRWPFLADKTDGLKGTDGVFSKEKSEKMIGYKSEYTWRNNK